MIGRLLYRFRTKFRHGFRTAYWRDVVRPRILATRPVLNNTDAACEIHVLTSSSDWLNLVWALKSFYVFSGRRYRLCIHEDGSLEAAQLQALTEHFPQARLIRRTTADRDVLPTLGSFPRCQQFRAANTLALKLFDFRHYAESDRILLLDSDILFFSEPKELLARIEQADYRYNTANPDVSSAYTVTPGDVAARFGFELKPLFNSGLGLIHRDSLRLDWIEEFLDLPGIGSHSWRIEQTLFALCSWRYGAELLSDEYRVKLVASSGNSCCKHYVGAIRQHMYSSGIKQLIEASFLDACNRA